MRSLVLLVLSLSLVSPASGRNPEVMMDLARNRLSALEGEIVVDGLEEPVEVIRDPWGVAHIYAQTEHDLFLAQGFVAAQDRLWQMEWWRRFGEGSLAEVLGPAALAHDRFARLLRYRGDLEAEYGSYHARGREILTAFVAGVNAYIGRVRDRRPVEFELTGIHPVPWTVETPILRMAGLAMTGNNLRELALARAVAEHGLEEANRRDAPDPWHELTLPEGLDPSLIPGDFVERAVGPQLPAPALRPEVERLLEPSRSVATAITAALDRLTARAAIAGRDAGEGSNNWVVDASLSATGAPLLANDPHRSLALPSLRYLVHLDGPGWNVIGGGEPSLPGVAIGHNERVGWGLTIVGIDQGDIFVERLDPQDEGRVWHDGGWQPLRVVEERIAVRGEAPRMVRLEFSHHGPIVYKDVDAGLAWSFRTVLTEPGTAGYLGSLRLGQVGDWEQYVEAMRGWKVPSENMIYADVDGNIGWLAAGLAPRRQGPPGWVGRLPVPGTGDWEWDGFRDVLELPSEYNPERGFIATANHNIMPEGYEPPLGYRWAAPHRFERIRRVLSEGGPFTVADFQALQYEVYSEVAAARIAPLASWSFADPDAEMARALLADWDAVLDADSSRAAVYKTWEDEVETALAGEPFADLDPAAAEATLAVAVGRLRQEQGTDPATWSWGASNRMTFEHPLVDVFDAGAVARPGDATTVNVGGRRHGASFREILDFSDWDRSVATSVPGQSGQPGSPHYADLLPLWQEGEYFPLLFSRAAVERHAEHRLLLLPPGLQRRDADGR